jgi:hypothetical protein
MKEEYILPQQREKGKKVDQQEKTERAGRQVVKAGRQAATDLAGGSQG